MIDHDALIDGQHRKMADFQFLGSCGQSGCPGRLTCYCTTFFLARVGTYLPKKKYNFIEYLDRHDGHI